MTSGVPCGTSSPPKAGPRRELPDEMLVFPARLARRYTDGVRGYAAHPGPCPFGAAKRYRAWRCKSLRGDLLANPVKTCAQRMTNTDDTWQSYTRRIEELAARSGLVFHPVDF